MKLFHTQYLELVVHHKDSVLTEYPSRFCVIRVPLEKLLDNSGSIFSIGQLRKILSIGFFDCPDSYVINGHRPFDRSFMDVNSISSVFLKRQLSISKELYKFAL